FAVLVPTSDVISLDVITSAPREVAPGQRVAPTQDLAELPPAPAPAPAPVVERSPAAAEVEESPVETAPVDPVVREHPMEAEAEPADRPRVAPRRTTRAPERATTVVSDPEP